MKRFLISTSFSAALLSGAALAQTDESIEEELPPWYQFEMVIFAFQEPKTSERLFKTPFEEAYQQFPHAAESSKHFSLNELFEPPLENTDLEETEAQESVLTNSLEQDQHSLATEELDPLAEETLEEPIEPELLAATEEEFILAEQALMLKYRRGYKVIWHNAWQQPLPQNSDIRHYDLHAGPPILEPKKEEIALNDSLALDAMMTAFSTEDTLLEVEPLSNLPSSSFAEEFIPTDQLFLSEYQQAIAERDEQSDFQFQLQGSVQVFRKTFAHLNFDLWFAEIDDSTPTEPLLFIDETWPKVEETSGEVALSNDVADVATNKNIVTSPLFEDNEEITETLETAVIEPLFTKRYEDAYQAKRFGRITESRRVRSGELYYVDHPLFGIVIQIKEVDHPKLRETTETVVTES